MRPLISLLLALTFAVGAIPAVEPAPVLAADGCGDQAEPNFTVGEDATGLTLSCLTGGGGGDPTPPTSGSGAYCSAGWGYWSNPRYVDSTGSVRTYSGTTAASAGGVAGGPALSDLLRQAYIRAREAIRRTGGSLGDSFYWATAPLDVTAMILQIEPVYVPGDSLTAGSTAWRFRRMPGASRSQYWNTGVDGVSRNITTVTNGQIIATRDERYGEYSLTASPIDATRLRVGSYTKAQIDAATSGGARDDIFALVGRSFGSLVGTSAYPIKEVVDIYLTPTDTWTSAALPAGSSLALAYANADVKYYGAGGIRAAFDLVGANGPISLADLALLPADAPVTVYAYTPNRRPLLRGLSYDTLSAGLRGIVDRNLRKSIGQTTIDDYGAGIDETRYYAFPAFHAPSDPTRPGVCSRDEFSLNTSQGLSVRHLVPWNTSSFNGCRTTAVSTLARYETHIPFVQGLRGSACWLNWRIIRIPEPKFAWSDSLNAFMPQVSYYPTAVGAVGDQIRIAARRTAAGSIAYRSGTLALPIPWGEDRQSNAVARLPTYYNLTQVGLSAEVGVPGSGGQILARVTRTSRAAREYDLTLTFARTALEQYQTAACRNRSAADLMTYCGIGYNATLKEWYYRVRLRTWYGGIYYAPGAPLNEPKLRGIFNYQHTAGLPASLLNSVPERIRDYRWPTTNAFFQDDAIRFTGRNSPLFELTGGYWTEMRNLAAGLDTDGSAVSPSRPAYTYSAGGYYPIADASGFSACASGFGDGTRCYVDVYVRSRQPIVGN